MAPIIMIISAALFASITLATNATTPSAADCVDSSSMSSCLQAAQNKSTTCVDQASDDLVASNCQYQEWIEEMVCYQASCWNKVYSCEYQNLAIEYLFQDWLNNDTIPFFPPPDNAPGGCSCSLGSVYTDIFRNGVVYLANVLQNTTDPNMSDCCFASALISAPYGICPENSPADILTPFNISLSDLETYSSNCSRLTADTCTNYGFESADNGTFLDPAVPPSPGTQRLSTTPGPSSLTAPPAGATITWTALNQTFTVTAATAATSSAKKGSASSIHKSRDIWRAGILCLGGLFAML